MSYSPLFVAVQDTDLFGGVEPRHPLIEPSLFYDPPYDGPLDDTFAWHLVKYLEPIGGLLYRDSVILPHGEVVLDFVVEHGPRRIGFVLTRDGDVEDDRAMRYNDALLVTSGSVDALFRLRADDVRDALEDALFCVARVEPSLFSERGRVNLHTLASGAARRVQPRRGDTDLVVRQDDGDGVVVQWLSDRHPAAWTEDVERALGFFEITPATWGRRWARSA